MPIIAELLHVTYTHWNQTTPTLVDVSLQLEKGTLNILVGPGGSGKSTLCNVFNGEIPHLLGGKFEGDVLIDGVNTRTVHVKDLSCKVGHVFQDPESMFATLTVEDEIAFGPENLCFTPEHIRQVVTELLAETGLETVRDHLVWALSGGQIQKLGLAAILAMQPELIILDEPTSNLDPAATQSVQQLVLDLREQGKTILLVTRELDDFLAQADQLIVLEQGRLFASGTPREVLGQYGHELQSLGIWLPETSEIGLALTLHASSPTRQTDSRNTRQVPITIEETLERIQEEGLGLQGVTGRPPQAHPQLGERLISAREVTYAYGKEAQALAGISLDIHAGEMLAIVGRNGAGKSTLAHLLVGLLHPQGGSLDLFGKPADRWKVQDLANEIALVFQNPEHQFLTDSVSDEIDYSLLSRGITNLAQRTKAIQETLGLLGLSDFAKVHPFALSAGMKRRLGVATMLAHQVSGQPKVLLVDEPTYGQDKQMTQTLMALMGDIRRQGISIVMITHDMRLVLEYAERVVVMSAGQICYDGEPVGLFQHDEILQAANLCPTLLHRLIQTLQARGIRVQGDLRTVPDLVRALCNPTQAEGLGQPAAMDISESGELPHG